jgi:coproporphyrinogen III oxidase
MVWWRVNDLTPMGQSYDEDTKHFHSTAKMALDPFGEDLYTTFLKQAAEYFYIPHRKNGVLGGFSLITSIQGILAKILRCGKILAARF